MKHPLKNIIDLQKKNIPVGICSICSSNKLVIEAAMKRGLELNTHVLIEATANQVNQYGGYTGMKPQDFRVYIEKIAGRMGFPMEKVILGGDHLGPLTWVHLNEAEAMVEAGVLIRQFVKAGFTKIHVDTSMRVADDDIGKPLSTEVIARRGAKLVQIAERAYEELLVENENAMQPVYVIGSEVPIPGGAQEEEEGVQVTRVADFNGTVDLFKRAFGEYGIEDSWEKVIAVVVQPGVEFGDDSIHEYDRRSAWTLTDALRDFPTIVLEGHSTDYQTPQKLKEMVEDGIAILKVGPALTFALREALFSLNRIENELLQNDGEKASNLVENLESVMMRNPSNWKKHYHGDEKKLRLSRKYSFSDRARYYIGIKEIEESIETLIGNLREQSIPLSLLSQYVPVQYNKIRKGLIKNDPYDILLDSVVSVMDEYYYAVVPDTISTIKNNLS